jgi:hypothetical protein
MTPIFLPLSMEGEQSIQELLGRMRLEMQPVERADLKGDLCTYINYLVLNDFQTLVQLLYRIDVSEKGLKEALKAHPGSDAAPLIADMILKRQEEKLLSKKNTSTNTASSDDERW